MDATHETPGTAAAIPSGVPAADARAAGRLVERFEPRLLDYARRHPTAARVPDRTPAELVRTTWELAFQSGALERFERRGSGAFLRWIQRLFEHAAAAALRASAE